MHTDSRKRFVAVGKIAAPLAVTGLIAAACGSSGGGTGAGAAGGAGNTAAATPRHAATTVDLHRGAGGSYLTDSQGRALYLFTADSAHRSRCAGSCLAVWPPLTTAAGVSAGAGVAASSLSTIPAGGGKRQVEYSGHPLYLFAGDHGAGSTSGQGSRDFGASWWLVSPSGAELTTRPGSGSSGSSSSSGSGSSHGGGSGGGGGYW